MPFTSLKLKHSYSFSITVLLCYNNLLWKWAIAWLKVHLSHVQCVISAIVWFRNHIITLQVTENCYIFWKLFQMVKNNQLKTSLIRCVFNQNSISIIMRNYITRYKTKINDLMQAADWMLQHLIASGKNELAFATFMQDSDWWASIWKPRQPKLIAVFQSVIVLHSQ